MRAPLAASPDVVLTKRERNPKDGRNFGWKEMDEFMGPCEASCPAPILDMLSPFTPEGEASHASEWWDKCREAIAHRKAAPKLREGLKAWFRLDHVLIFGARHLRRILTTYSCYYNETRTHLSLDKDAPLGRAVQPHGTFVAVPILSGLHHCYARI